MQYTKCFAKLQIDLTSLSHIPVLYVKDFEYWNETDLRKFLISILKISIHETTISFHLKNYLYNISDSDPLVGHSYILI